MATTPDDLLARAKRLHDPAAALDAVRELRVRLDRLEAIHVENGLRAGWRWRDVAAALNLSKQAVHRRYAKAMRERLDTADSGAPVRLALRFARQEADAAGCRAVGTHHVLLGLTRLEGSPVAERLAAAGARADLARAALAQLGPDVEATGAAGPNGRLPLTPACRAAAGEHDPALRDVGGELGRRLLERLLDRLDDRLERLLEHHADLMAGQQQVLGQPADEVAPAHLGLQLLRQGDRRAELELQLL